MDNALLIFAVIALLIAAVLWVCWPAINNHKQYKKPRSSDPEPIKSKRSNLEASGKGQLARVCDASSNILKLHEAPGMLYRAIQERIEDAAIKAPPLPDGTVASDSEIEQVAYMLVFKSAMESMDAVDNLVEDTFDSKFAASMIYNESMCLAERVAETMVSKGYLEKEVYEELKNLPIKLF